MAYSPSYAGNNQPQMPAGYQWSPFDMMPPPNYIPYNSAQLAPTTQGLVSGIDMSAGNQALKNFSQEANRTGPSRWSTMAQGEQDKLATDAQSKAAMTAGGAAAGARDQLAMRGGLSSGARERVGRNASRDYMNMSQDITNNRMNNGMQLSMNDEQNRIQQLGMVPQMQNQANEGAWKGAGMQNQAAEFDINNQNQNTTASNAFNLGRFNSQMQGWAANQQANATKNSGGSSFICTALREKGLMSRRETALMTKFMVSGILDRADFFAWYFRKGAKAIQLAKRQNFDFSLIKSQFVDDILNAWEEKGREAAEELYIRRAGYFVTLFLGDQSGFRPSLVKKNRLRAWLSLPVVFSLPSTWKWIYQFKLARRFA